MHAKNALNVSKKVKWYLKLFQTHEKTKVLVITNLLCMHFTQGVEVGYSDIVNLAVRKKYIVILLLLFMFCDFFRTRLTP